MPILDKMNQNNMPDDDDNRPRKPINFDDVPPDNPKRQRQAPELLPARKGRAQISMAALVERIVDQFRAEHTPDDSQVRAAQTRADRASLLLPVVDYVLAVESVGVDEAGKTDVLWQAYSALFGFGPLDQFIDDESVTTVSIEGAEKISIRRGHGELEAVPPLFEDNGHFKQIVERLLARCGVKLRDDMPIVEAGLRAENGRFVSMSMFAPPVTYALSLDVRLHPVAAPTLAALVERGTLTKGTAAVLRALVQSDYGFTVVGQPESGKTMTLSALLSELPNPAQAVAVERTGELHLPEGMARAVVQWPQGTSGESGENEEDAGVTFGEQIQVQAGEGYRVIVLDEVRADEPHTIAPLLSADEDDTANASRLIWSFRGAPDSKRLVSALGMLARRADVANGEALVRNLFTRMPFVVSVRRLAGKIELRELGEWVYPDGSDYVVYRPLLQTSGGETYPAGDMPAHALPGIDAAFWAAEG